MKLLYFAAQSISLWAETAAGGQINPTVKISATAPREANLIVNMKTALPIRANI
jgi:hypothetical protein